jgi:hypothetical protein
MDGQRRHRKKTQEKTPTRCHEGNRHTCAEERRVGTASNPRKKSSELRQRKFPPEGSKMKDGEKGAK